MVGTVIETAHINQPLGQFSYWREVICESWFGLWAERSGTDAFDARVEMHDLGQLQIARAKMPPHRMGRGAAEIAGLSQGAYCLHHIHEGAVYGEYRGSEYEALPGELLLFDTRDPCDFNVKHQLDSTILHIPHYLLQSRLGGDKSTPLRLSAHEGMSALLSSYVSSLSQSLAMLGPNGMERAGDILCQLIAATFALPVAAEDCQGGIREARLTAAKRYMAANLTDASLGVGKVAAHLGVSNRYVHKLFEGTGRTFSETLLLARLEACERALLSPSERHRTIADIAFAFGFNDLSWFYRCYRAQLSETPGETRMRACKRKN